MPERTITEPVREWLRELSALDRKTTGEDVKTVQFGWPLGMPLVRKLDINLLGSAHPSGEPYSTRTIYGIRGQDCFAARFYQKISSNTQGRS